MVLGNKDLTRLWGLSTLAQCLLLSGVPSWRVGIDGIRKYTLSSYNMRSPREYKKIIYKLDRIGIPRNKNNITRKEPQHVPEGDEHNGLLI